MLKNRKPRELSNSRCFRAKKQLWCAHAKSPSSAWKHWRHKHGLLQHEIWRYFSEMLCEMLWSLFFGTSAFSTFECLRKISSHPFLKELRKFSGFLSNLSMVWNSGKGCRQVSVVPAQTVDTAGPIWWRLHQSPPSSSQRSGHDVGMIESATYPTELVTVGPWKCLWIQ